MQEADIPRCTQDLGALFHRHRALGLQENYPSIPNSPWFYRLCSVRCRTLLCIQMLGVDRIYLERGCQTLVVGSRHNLEILALSHLPNDYITPNQYIDPYTAQNRHGGKMYRKPEAPKHQRSLAIGFSSQDRTKPPSYVSCSHSNVSIKIGYQHQLKRADHTTIQ